MASSENSSAPKPTADGGATQTGDQVVLRQPAEEVELRRGDILAARYQIEKVIGYGATGCVVQAFDRVVRNVVALKILKPDRAADPRWVDRLGGELRYARRLQHPNVCRVFEIAEADGVHFLTMELARGGSLRQRLADAPDRPLEARLRDARAVIDGLAAIHRENVIHRDVKPENVLVMEDGRLVVTDLGLAVTLGQMTLSSSRVAGTPSYMAPEVLMGDKATLTADVWSLGVVLHEILFGKRPEWLVTKQSRSVKSPVDRDAPRLLRGMADLCDDCLQESPHRRLRDATAVKRRFDEVIEGRWRPLSRGLRESWPAASASVLFVAALGAGALALRNRRPAAPSAGAPRYEEIVVTGTAREFAAPRILLRAERAIRCLDPLPGDRAVRVVLTGPPEAVDIDLTTGQQHKTDLVPEAFRVGCPRSSPDGTALLFTTMQGRGASLQIMLSRRSDGRDAEPLIPGSLPMWLPEGGEFIFSFDPRHLAAMTLTAKRPVLFPEVAPDHHQFMDATATHLGRRIAALFSDGKGGSFVDLYEYPSLALLETVHSNSAIITLAIARRARGLGLTMQDPRNAILGSLADDHSLRRWNKVAGLNVGWTTLMEPGLVFTTYLHTTSVLVRDRLGAERPAVIDQVAYSPTVSDDGAVAVQTVLPDGRSVIALATDGGQLRPVTAGPVDVLPKFIPGRNAFVHTDVSHDALVVCTLKRADVPNCQTIRSEPLLPVAPLPSPDGSHIAYLTDSGVRRARIISVDGTLARDLPGFHTDCPLRWASNKTLWAFHRAESRWIEVDTGRTVGVDNVDDACDRPPVMEDAARNAPPFSLRTVWHKRATVGVVDGFAQSNADF